MTPANNEAQKANIQVQIKKIFNEYSYNSATGGYWLEISADDLDEFTKRIVDEIITQ
jgi:hypothetical protein